MHTRKKHAVPKVPFKELALDDKFKQLKDIIDIAFDNTVYDHDMNWKARQQLEKYYPEGMFLHTTFIAFFL